MSTTTTSSANGTRGRGHGLLACRSYSPVSARCAREGDGGVSSRTGCVQRQELRLRSARRLSLNPRVSSGRHTLRAIILPSRLLLALDVPRHGRGTSHDYAHFFSKKDEARILFITSSSQWRSPLEMGRRTCLFILPRTLQPTNIGRRTCMGAEWRSPLEIGRANWIYVNGSHRNNESMDGVCNWRIWRESTSQSRRLVRGRLCSLASFTLLRVQKCN
jgi:hypothetical protein